MRRKKSDWTSVLGWVSVAGLVVIGLMLFGLFYRDNPQRAVFGAFIGGAFVWGLTALILRRPSGLRLPGKGGQLVCGLLCAASLAGAWNAEGLTQHVFTLIFIMLAVVTLLYPLFSIFGSGQKPLPKSPPRPPLPEAPKPKRKERRKPSFKRADRPGKRR